MFTSKSYAIRVHLLLLFIHNDNRVVKLWTKIKSSLGKIVYYIKVPTNVLKFANFKLNIKKIKAISKKF